MIVWGNATDVTADKALGSIGAFKDESGSKVKVTGGWLRNIIGTEGHLATEIFEAAKAAGISEKTLRRAKTELGVVSEKSASGWFWRMPRETTDADAELATLM